MLPDSRSRTGTSEKFRVEMVLVIRIWFEMYVERGAPAAAIPLTNRFAARPDFFAMSSVQPGTTAGAMT